MKLTAGHIQRIPHSEICTSPVFVRGRVASHRRN